MPTDPAVNHGKEPRSTHLFHPGRHRLHHTHHRTFRHVARHRQRHAIAAFAVSLLAAVGVLLAVAPAQAQTHPTGCARHDMTVTLTADTHTPRYQVAGWLCGPRDARTVQLLMSGFTYDHHYWDPGPSRRYSYLRAAVAAGAAVYNVDRVGVGYSDRAPADQLTATSEAYVAHQLVQALRGGALGGFDRVVGVGHSYGSAIWMVETARYHDVDALVLTGLLHHTNPAALTTFVGTLHPASDDAAFAHTGVPDGYLTTMPGTRSSDFYYPPGADTRMVALDENTKTTGTTGELGSVNVAQDPAVSQTLHLPVLVIVGDHDALICNASAGLPCRTGTDLCQRERPFYPPDSPLYATTIPAAGHSIDFHRTAPAEYTTANAWIAQTIASPQRHGLTTKCPARTATTPSR